MQGTLPFMSVRVVDGLLYGKNVARTVWDDLESFAWILLWEYLFRGKARDCLTDHEQLILKASDDCRLVRAAKVEMTCYRFSCNVGLSFMPLITKWIACVEPKAAPESWQSVYEEFLDIAVQSLSEAQDWDSWDDFFTRKQNT
ncbi:hypothetical protein QCA50_003367 [Cerrena zonata]|uniref:Fungal-type protein kinase domain-containing protein n=1 Tax=Cerrena zonata TaxID=2478898 RepID=A0AAW0GKN4_9APHY